MNVFSTFLVPASVGAKAVAICDALGFPEKGMFSTKVADDRVVAYVSSGIVDDTCPLLGSDAELFAACEARTAVRGETLTVTLADCTSVVNALDRGDIEPHRLMRAVIAESKGQVATPLWVAGTVYGPHEGVTHNGVKYLNLARKNTTEPPGAGWRLLKGAA